MVDIVLAITYLAVLSAVVVVLWAIVRGIRQRDRSAAVVNGIPVRRVALGVVGLLVVSLSLTFLLGSSAPMTVNGYRFAETFWLKAADMFINTSLILLLIAIVAVVCSNVRNVRSRR